MLHIRKKYRSEVRFLPPMDTIFSTVKEIVKLEILNPQKVYYFYSHMLAVWSGAASKAMATPLLWCWNWKTDSPLSASICVSLCCSKRELQSNWNNTLVLPWLVVIVQCEKEHRNVTSGLEYTISPDLYLSNNSFRNAVHQFMAWYPWDDFTHFYGEVAFTYFIWQ